jgi:hypothetical protein
MLSLPHAPPLLAALPPNPTISETLVFQLNGLIVVSIALCSIWGAVELIGWFYKRAATAAAKSPAPATSALAAGSIGASEAAEIGTAPAPSGIDPNTITVIAAAVHATLGGRHRVRAITTGEVHIEWAQEGRRQIFASHKVR